MIDASAVFMPTKPGNRGENYTTTNVFQLAIMTPSSFEEPARALTRAAAEWLLSVRLP
jgi:hypothetical protein